MYETSTDKFHYRNQDIYRVMMVEPISMEKGVITFFQLPSKLISNYPEVELATHVYYPRKTFVYKEDSSSSDFFAEDELLYVEPDFLSIFNFPLAQGDGQKALAEPKSMILTRTAAKKYFGDENVVGKVLYIKKEPYTVNGVLEDVSFNTQLRFSFLISKASLPASGFPLSYAGLTFIRLKEGTNVQDFENKLESYQQNLLPLEVEKKLEKPFSLQSLSESYFYQSIPTFLSPILRTGNRDSINMLILVATVIVVLSIFNYLNFSNSKALATLKEYHIKRVFGAPKNILKWHLTLEALIFVIISLMLSCAFTLLIAKTSNQLLNTNLGADFFSNTRVILSVLLLPIAVIFILGPLSYFSFLGLVNSTSFPEKLQGSRISQLSSLIFIVQLTGSSILVSIALTVVNQVNFIKDHPAGFQTKNMIEINLSGIPESIDMRTIKHEATQIPGIVSSTLAYGSPLTGRWTTSLETDEGTIEIGSYNGDEDFIQIFDVEILQGRNIQAELASDSNAVLINESGKRLLELDENLEPANKKINLSSKIVGVVKDFHYSSLSEKIGPAIIGYSPFKTIGDFGGAKLILKSSSLNQHQLDEVKKIVGKFSSDRPFEYLLLEEKYNSLHAKEINQLKMIIAGSCISILISIFGLIGLSLFLTERKLKEVAIRKTLGASAQSITIMFMKRLGIFVILSFLMSIPFSTSFALQWLSNFAYKATLSPMIWILAFVIMVVITLISVYGLLYRTATKNPTVVLRQDS